MPPTHNIKYDVRQFVGRTIKMISATSYGCSIDFTDGSNLEIDPNDEYWSKIEVSSSEGDLSDQYEQAKEHHRAEDS